MKNITRNEDLQPIVAVRVPEVTEQSVPYLAWIARDAAATSLGS